jgi:uncharacterized protein with ParB-like and HNH nuclease domain
MENNKFTTEIYSIKKLNKQRFVIPSYQRPYVWGDVQINKLLSDFHEAYSRTETYDYYIGTVLLKDNGKDVYQLIDGQQRFTTLWLIAVAFRILKSKSDIETFLTVGDELRLDFAIRKQIKSYLRALMEKQANDKNQYSDSEVEKDAYLVHIAKAITIIIGKIKTLEFQKDKSLQDFGNYIYQNVYFVANTVPQNTDLNKLFATINNSGIQLEQHDILKSLLLKKITTEKTTYSRIWEACENMNNYFEKNAKQLFPNEFDWGKIDFDNLKEFNITETKSDFAMENQDNSYMISDILIDNVIQGEDEIKLKTDYSDDKNEDNNVYCRSIIKFPQLLLHTYRIFLKQQGKADFDLPFHSNNLLRIFKPLSDETEQDIIKEFFKCLWSVRFAFDKYIVKWRQMSEDKIEELVLTSVYKSENSFSRTNQTELNDVSMLQSMMYFTGNYNTQIWLTPYLKRLIDGEDTLLCLETIDNKLSLSMLSDKGTSFILMDHEFILSEDKIFDFENYLKGSNGTAFRHYWFQKLEYILWKEFNQDELYKTDKQFQNYRITSKNSVEHIFPQNHEFIHKIIDVKYLDDFGNLALLSVSQNSSYSNQDVKKKKVDFDNKSTYDSLKLVFVYKNTDLDLYSGEKIIEHRNLMIEKIKEHYKI